MKEKIYNDALALEDVLEEQTKFENKIDKSKESTKPKTLDNKENKLDDFWKCT